MARRRFGPTLRRPGVSRAIFDANLKGLKLNWSLPHLVLPDPGGPGRSASAEQP